MNKLEHALDKIAGKMLFPGKASNGDIEDKRIREEEKAAVLSLLGGFTENLRREE